MPLACSYRCFAAIAALQPAACSLQPAAALQPADERVFGSLFSQGSLLPSPHRPLELQYADFAAWQRERYEANVESGVIAASAAWWVAELAGT